MPRGLCMAKYGLAQGSFKYKRFKSPVNRSGHGRGQTQHFSSYLYSSSRVIPRGAARRLQGGEFAPSGLTRSLLMTRNRVMRNQPERLMTRFSVTALDLDTTPLPVPVPTTSDEPVKWTQTPSKRVVPFRGKQELIFFQNFWQNALLSGNLSFWGSLRMLRQQWTC